MMKPYIKGKTASTKPMYSRSLILPRVYENIHPSCIEKQCFCSIIVQVSCTYDFLGLFEYHSVLVPKDIIHSL